MTDNAVTDGDLRNARLWAEKVGPPYASPGYIGTPSEIYNVARVILATVEAPAPTLAERLQYRADMLDNGDPDGDTPQALRDLATDAAQMEHDLAEAHADLADVTEVNHEIRRERDEARAEVERLTAVNETLRRTDNYREFKEFLTVQKGAESSAESLDPADVEPGEAWVVECGGEKRPAVKDRNDDVPWNTVAADGLFFSEENETVTLLHRLVPAPRVITDLKDLNALAATSIIRDGRGWPGGITDQGVTMINGFRLSDEEVIEHGPVTVLWEDQE